MTEAEEELAHLLKLRFRTAPDEPTEEQLGDILSDLSHLVSPTDDDWRQAVYRHCPGAGKYKYGSIENSDLNELLKRIAEEARDARQKTDKG